MIITIDGPAGSGKSTIAREAAKRLNFSYLDTGAMYRAVTWKVLREKVDLDDEEGIARISGDCRIDMRDARIYVNNFDVTEAIRLPDVGQAVSLVSRVSEVRRHMVEKQRQIATSSDIVIEGRDIGTVVFPNADIKIFLTADVKERARRRLVEFRQKGLTVEVGAVEDEIGTRDRIDSNRSVSPLEKAADAVEVDSTDKSIEEVVDLVIKMAKK